MILVFVGGLLFIVLVVVVLVIHSEGSMGSMGMGPGSAHAGRVVATLASGAFDASIVPGSGAGSGRSRFGKVFTAGFPVKTGAVVSFDILFQSGFEWGCRGKVGGLYMGTAVATGGHYSTAGSTHRLMWGPDGNAFSYVYVPAGTQSRQPPPLNTRRTYGVSVFEPDFKKAFRTNAWHHVELGVRLNTVGKPDGGMLLSIDGKARTLGGITWRLGDHGIKMFVLGIFHGGGCTATRHSKISFRNIRLHAWT